MQKSIFYSLTLIIFLASCGQKPTNSLEEKKALLAEKTQQLAALQTEVNALQEEINKEEPRAEKEALNVTTLPITKSSFTRNIDLQAVVSTDDIVNAGSDVGGRITRVVVKEGQKVTKNQLIASVDLESVNRQKEEIEKSLDLATDVYNRQKRLWEQNIGSEIQYLESKNNKERLEKSIQVINAQLKKQNVYAPIAGVVDHVYLKAGEVAAPGAPIVNIVNSSKVKVVSDVPENYLGKVKVGDNVKVTFPSLNQEVDKKVSLISTTIDPANRTFAIEVNMENPKGLLKPNLLASVQINDLTLHDVIVVPVDNILQEVTGNRYVYVAKEVEGKLKAVKVPVELGESANNMIVVKSGLQIGDQIIIKGSRIVTEGQQVIVEK